MPSRYPSWINRQRQEAFKNGRKRPTMANDLEHWHNRHGIMWDIDDMSVKKLQRAISYIERGYKCYGQRSKIVSLRRVLAEKQRS